MSKRGIEVRVRRATALILACLWIVEAPLKAECNTAPIANDDLVKMLEKAQIDVLSNDSDAEGHMLSVAVVSTTCPGTTSVDFELVTLDPQPRLQGDCTITYSVTDELGSSATATVQVRMITDIFADGFETGDATRWTSCDPSCS